MAETALNHADVQTRLDALRDLKAQIDEGVLPQPTTGGHVNNHIHTTYSFSPYSPSKAVWMAYNAGLTTAGIMDHDSISGAREFITAGQIMGIATTIGVECRADFHETPLAGRRINNPDQDSIAYLALHGIPHTQIPRVEAFFRPYQEERNARNRAMVAKINDLFASQAIRLDFEQDVLPLSMYHEGGSVTERHLSLGLARQLIQQFGRGEPLVEFLTQTLGLDIGVKSVAFLMDASNELYEYDLIGTIKASLIDSFYVDATSECPAITEVLALSREIGSISCYAYLGDVGDSVTGDKKAQKFEDDYLHLLFDVLKDLGFNAVTYMPARNSLSQLLRVKELCRQYGFLEVSGEDINSPRQSFVCPALQRPEFQNLIDTTWALIGHELLATEHLDQAMFSPATALKYPNLDERIAVYKGIGLTRGDTR